MLTIVLFLIIICIILIVIIAAVEYEREKIKRIKELEKFVIRLSPEKIEQIRREIEWEDKFTMLENIKILREKTAAPIGLCRQALDEVHDDIEKAIMWLKNQGIKQDVRQKITEQGIVITYEHTNNKIVSMIELQCQTDFVARNEKFKTLAKELAIHIAGNPTTPIAITKEEIKLTKEYKLERKRIADHPDMANKPDAIKDKIIDGRLKKFYKDNVLLEQSFVKDESVTVGQLIDSHIKVLKENINVGGFCRWVLGNKPIICNRI